MTACSSPITRPSRCSRSSPACRAWAKSISSGPASIRCGFGSIPTSFMRVRSRPRTSSTRSKARTSKSPPASSGCRRGRTHKLFSTPSTSPAASTMSASSRTSSSRPKRTGRWSTCATSGGSSWVRRPTARSSRSTASPRRASAFFRRWRRTRSMWRAKSPRKWTSSRKASRRDLPTAFPSTPPRSCASPSKKYGRRCSRRRSWC